MFILDTQFRTAHPLPHSSLTFLPTQARNDRKKFAFWDTGERRILFCRKLRLSRKIWSLSGANPDNGPEYNHPTTVIVCYQSGEEDNPACRLALGWTTLGSRNHVLQAVYAPERRDVYKRQVRVNANLFDQLHGHHFLDSHQLFFYCFVFLTFYLIC